MLPDFQPDTAISIKVARRDTYCKRLAWSRVIELVSSSGVPNHDDGVPERRLVSKAIVRCLENECSSTRSKPVFRVG